MTTNNSTSNGTSGFTPLNGTSGYTPAQVLEYEYIAWGVAGGCTCLACLLSFVLIYLHLINWTKQEQIYIVRLLLMVPIYAIDSWFSLRWKDYAIYFDIFRDCYEAFVIYQFFLLLTAYIEGNSPGTLFKKLEEKPAVKYPPPLCFLPHFKPSPLFLILTKQCILQYVIVLPLMSFLAAILQANGDYHQGDFHPWYGYVYVTAVTFASVTVSMYFLVWFYFTTEDDLQDKKPVAKFLCIKAILFFSFWQGVLIAIITYFNVIPQNVGNWTQDNISRGLQDFIICIEMLMLSIAHIWVFSYEPYLPKEDDEYHSSPIKNFAIDVMNPTDVVKDVKRAYHPKHIKHAKREHKRVKVEYKNQMKQLSDTQQEELGEVKVTVETDEVTLNTDETKLFHE